MRSILSILFSMVVLAGASSPAHAQPADAAIRARGLGGNAACLAFVAPEAVEYRKRRWRAAIDEVWEKHPQYVLKWVVGAAKPPTAALQEATKQRDCLIDLIVGDAADPSTRLILDYQKEAGKKAGMRRLGEQYGGSRTFRKRLGATLTESHYRDARTQSWIWKRKFVFSGRNFNYVSLLAGQRCGIEPRQSWKPDNAAHRRCWQDQLTNQEREREILQASSAPGISRHHWGTDFDFFGLRPAAFRTGRYADEYLWMTHNALGLGFFQPYATSKPRGHRYMEERWHWSYYPIAQALLEFAASHPDEVAEALDTLWSGFESRWNAGRREDRPFFTFVRAHWREFMFGVDSAPVRNR